MVELPPLLAAHQRHRVRRRKRVVRLSVVLALSMARGCGTGTAHSGCRVHRWARHALCDTVNTDLPGAFRPPHRGGRPSHGLPSIM